MIVLPSIRHTGTRFMRDLLKNQEFISRHIGEKFLDDLEPHIDNNIVIPMRKLDNIIQSWEKRQMRLDDLHSALNILIDRYYHRNPLWMPVDADNRQMRLDAINARFSLSLSTLWEPIGTAHKSPPQAREAAQIDKLHTDFDFLFLEIYGRS